MFPSMAVNRSVLLVWILCFIVWSYKNNYGVKGGSPLSKEEDIELEKQLKLLNKPAVKTIQTEFGDTYDCVDFYKQPAFDHPLLKNHTFHSEMRPSSVPKVMRDKGPFTANKTAFKIGLKGLGCPYGTVPIRRVTRDDLIRAKLYSNRDNSKNGSEFGVLTLDNPGTHYCGIRTIFNSSKKYGGAGTFMTIFNPDVESSQYSSARLKIKNEPDSIQVGWTVNPTLYDSYDVRLYTYLKTHQSQCFNAQCPGFVIVNTDIPLDMRLEASQIGASAPYNIDILIYRDRANGNWWLEIKRTLIGFWPGRIFTGLADSAYEVEWGGEVSGPPYIPSPQMGSGASFEEGEGNFNHDAYFYEIKTVNEANKIGYALNVEDYKDVITDVYRVSDLGKRKGYVQHIVFFGGPGGLTGS